MMMALYVNLPLCHCSSLAAALSRRSSGTVSDMRMYPSPCFPYPVPGVTTILASSRREAANCIEL